MRILPSRIAIFSIYVSTLDHPVSDHVADLVALLPYSLYYQAVLNAGVAPRLVELLGSTTSTVQTPALRTVGNIVTGDDSQVPGIIPRPLPTLLTYLYLNGHIDITMY